MVNAPCLDTHGQSPLKSEPESTNGPTKWISVQQQKIDLLIFYKSSTL